MKPLINLALKAYFRKITVIGRENIPSKGPVLFLTNHPSAFMDPLIVAVTIPKPLHYIAAAEFFKKGIVEWIYKHQFNMIPVYRKEKFENKDNTSMYQACYENLQKDKMILIFPEGNSVTEHRLRPLKTGAARIKLGAEEYMNGEKEVQVIPIGLNYASPHHFLSDITVSIGEPIDFSELNPDSTSAIADYTQAMAEGLSNQMWNIPHPSLDGIVRKVIKVFTIPLIQKLDQQNRNDAAEFRLQRQIIEGIGYFKDKDPERVDKADEMLDDYLTQLKSTGVDDRYISHTSSSISIYEGFILVLGSILAIPSILINALPFFASRAYFRSYLLPKLRLDAVGDRYVPTFAGSAAFAVGLVLYILWYVILSIIAAYSLHMGWLACGLFLAFYFTGMFGLRWLEILTRVIRKRRLRRLFDSHRESFSELILKRKAILDLMEESRNEFLQSTRDSSPRNE